MTPTLEWGEVEGRVEYTRPCAKERRGAMAERVAGLSQRRVVQRRQASIGFRVHSVAWVPPAAVARRSLPEFVEFGPLFRYDFMRVGGEGTFRVGGGWGRPLFREPGAVMRVLVAFIRVLLQPIFPASPRL